jgi:hypothetical protein
VSVVCVNEKKIVLAKEQKQRELERIFFTVNIVKVCQFYVQSPFDIYKSCKVTNFSCVKFIKERYETHEFWDQFFKSSSLFETNNMTMHKKANEDNLHQHSISQGDKRERV